MNYNLSTNEYKYKAINPFTKSHKRCYVLGAVSSYFAQFPTFLQVSFYCSVKLYWMFVCVIYYV